MGATGFEEAVETSKKSNGLQEGNADCDAEGAAKPSPTVAPGYEAVPNDPRMILGALAALSPETLRALGVLIQVIGQPASKQTHNA